MTDIPHVLYNTVGADFEKYLGGEDLLTLSQVSRTTRGGNLTSKFRELLIATLVEYDIFKINNYDNRTEVDITLDSFLGNIPLGVIYKDYRIEYGTDYNLLLDYIDADDETRLYVWIELCELEDFKKYMSRYANAKRIDVNTIYHNLLTQSSIRNRPDIVQELYSIYFTYYDDKAYHLNEYYQATEELRNIYMKYNSERIDDLILYGKIENREEYPIAYDIIDYDENEDKDYDDEHELKVERDADTFLHIFLFYATSFQEQDIFKQFYLKYRPKLSKTIERILDDKNLKYNINILDERLFIDYDP